jgi:putative ABC transport system ATP-binding protein
MGLENQHLMNLLLGKIQPTQGVVNIGDTSLNEFSSLDLAQTIAYVSQNTLLGTVPTFTVQHNIELAFLRAQKASFKLRAPDLSHIKQQLSLCNLGLENQLTHQSL